MSPSVGNLHVYHGHVEYNTSHIHQNHHILCNAETLPQAEHILHIKHIECELAPSLENSIYIVNI